MLVRRLLGILFLFSVTHCLVDCASSSGREEAAFSEKAVQDGAQVADSFGASDANDSRREARTNSDTSLSDFEVRTERMTSERMTSEPRREGVPENPPEARPDGGTPRCGAIRTFATGKQPSKTLFVATNGSDSNGNGSAGKPYRTVERAIKDAKPGTAIRLRSGVYKRRINITNVRGTAGAPIWIGGVRGEPAPVIEGSSEGIHLTKVSYLVLQNIEVRRAKNNGINCDDGGEFNNAKATHHVVFDRLYVHDIGGSGNQDCLKLSGLRDYYVLNSRFAKCGGKGSGSGVDHVGCHRGLIAYNRFESISGNAVQNKGGSQNIEIRWNFIKDIGQRGINMGGSTDFVVFRPPLSKSKPNAEARNIRVLSNVFVRGNAPVAFVGCVDCLVAHNTIVSPQVWPLRILQETTTRNGYTFLPTSNGKFLNNLIFFRRSQIRSFINIGPNTNAKSFQFANNLWYASDRPTASKPSGLPSVEVKGIYGKDPKFREVARGDYRLQASSPARGKGKPLAGIAGAYNRVCFQKNPSIGAFEYEP